MNLFEKEIIKLLKKETKLKEINLEVPPNPSMGDYAFPCFSLSKQYKKNPVEIAKEIASNLETNNLIKKIKEVGPYVNFFIDKSKMAEKVVEEILKEKEKYGVSKKTNKKILVEYPGPNTNKPLHLGHVRNMVLGYSLIRLLKALGHAVIPININNDRGIHICKSMLAYKKWGKGDTPEKSKMKSDFFVGKYYVMFAKKAKENPALEKEAMEILKKWEKGDKETIALWKQMNKWAFDGFKETYKIFDIKFEKEYFESQTYKKGKAIVLDGLKKKIFKKDENGAVIIDLNKQGYGNKVLLRADGTSVYITQDIYLAKTRYDDYKFDKLIYIVATEQNYHFKVLFEVLKKLKYPFADKLYHFAYGMVNLTTGKMKSREGTVVDADNLVDDIINLAKKETKKRHKLNIKELDSRAKKIGMGAIRFYILKNDAVKDMLFDPEVSISFEGETGPYVQYAYARICSVLNKAKKINNNVNYTVLNSKEDERLISLIASYPDKIRDAGENYRPHIIARYLIELAQAFNEFYHNCPILQSDKDVMNARLKLISAVKQVLANGLDLLGIEILEQM